MSLYTLTTAATVRQVYAVTQALDIFPALMANETGSQAEGLTADEAQLIRTQLAHQGFISYIWQEM